MTPQQLLQLVEGLLKGQRRGLENIDNVEAQEADDWICVTFDDGTQLAVVVDEIH